MTERTDSESIEKKLIKNLSQIAAGIQKITRKISNFSSSTLVLPLLYKCATITRHKSTRYLAPLRFGITRIPLLHFDGKKMCEQILKKSRDTPELTRFTHTTSRRYSKKPKLKNFLFTKFNAREVLYNLRFSVSDYQHAHLTTQRPTKVEAKAKIFKYYSENCPFRISIARCSNIPDNCIKSLTFASAVQLIHTRLQK